MEQDKPQLQKLGEVTESFPFKIDLEKSKVEFHESITDDDKIMLRNENGKWVAYKIL